MRRKALPVFILLLLCAALAGTAQAEGYGYTDASQIPMAYDFTVNVLFDDAGMPTILTNYPFEAAGADEMNLVYNTDSIDEAIVLNYSYSTGETRIASWSGNLSDDNPIDGFYRLVQSGEVTLDDHVYVNTSHFSRETDWILEYSLKNKRYTRYTERTYAQAFDAMGSGGVDNTAIYSPGRLDSVRVMKRSDDADLIMEYDSHGNLTDASIVQYSPEFANYDYDPSTGLFGGYQITDLGFEEADMEILPLASLEARKETTTTATAVSVPPAETRSPAVFAGSLLTGVLIGLALVTRLRRRMKERKEQKERAAADAAASRAAESPEPETVEPPRTMSASPGR